VAEFDKVIPPGQEGNITLVIEGNKVHGSFSKSATVRSNDPDRPVTTITLAGNEIPFVNVTPGERVYLQGSYDEAVSKTLTLSSNEEELDFEIQGLESNLDDKITYAYGRGEHSGEWVVTLNKNPKLPTLSTYGTLTIHTNSKQAPDKTIQVQVVTKGTITVQPSMINFGRVRFGADGQDGDVLNKTVTLIRSRGEFAIRDITLNNNHFEVKLLEEVPGKRYKIDVKFTAPARTRAAQAESGELIIYTDDPSEPHVRVQLVARAL
jgi:hypothetical protein